MPQCNWVPPIFPSPVCKEVIRFPRGAWVWISLHPALPLLGEQWLGCGRGYSAGDGWLWCTHSQVRHSCFFLSLSSLLMQPRLVPWLVPSVHFLMPLCILYALTVFSEAVFSCLISCLVQCNVALKLNKHKSLWELGSLQIFCWSNATCGSSAHHMKAFGSSARYNLWLT
jgi:hypothetical protein